MLPVTLVYQLKLFFFLKKRKLIFDQVNYKSGKAKTVTFFGVNFQLLMSTHFMSLVFF